MKTGLFRLLSILAITAWGIFPTSYGYASENMRMCRGGERNGPDKHCLVDEDTIWIHGANIGLKGFDTPEPTTDICGGQTEIELTHAASTRLLELLNSDSWTVETFGMDNTGKRLLGTIRIEGRDVGEILVAEGLARSWPDGEEWCG